jgi:hypothetical protein
VGEKDTYYLTKTWLETNPDSRYLDQLEKINPEAYSLMNSIIKDGKAYKASVVYGASLGSKLTYGRGLDSFILALSESTNEIELVKIIYSLE